MASRRLGKISSLRLCHSYLPALDSATEQADAAGTSANTPGLLNADDLYLLNLNRQINEVRISFGTILLQDPQLSLQPREHPTQYMMPRPSKAAGYVSSSSQKYQLIIYMPIDTTTSSSMNLPRWFLPSNPRRLLAVEAQLSGPYIGMIAEMRALLLVCALFPRRCNGCTKPLKGKSINLDLYPDH